MLMPTNIGEARMFVERHHSHLHAPLSGLCAVGVALDGVRVCVAVLSRPVSRELQAQGCAEVTRVASDGTKHAASKALAAIARAGLALGYRRLVSSILLGEAGTSYRAAGWWPTYSDRRDEREWDCASRPQAAAIQPGRKVRFEFGPEALPEDPRVAALILESVGKVALPPRRDGMPLFEGRTVLP